MTQSEKYNLEYATLAMSMDAQKDYFKKLLNHVAEKGLDDLSEYHLNNVEVALDYVDWREDPKALELMHLAATQASLNNGTRLTADDIRKNVKMARKRANKVMRRAK